MRDDQRGMWHLWVSSMGLLCADLRVASYFLGSTSGEIRRPSLGTTKQWSWGGGVLVT